MKKKILFSGNDGWSMYRYRGSVISRFVALGFEVHVVCGTHSSVQKIEETGATVHQFKQRPNGVNPLDEVLFFFRLHHIYRQIRPDFIFHYTVKPNIYGSIVARWLGIDCISVVAGAGPVFMGTGVVNRLIRFLYRKSSEKVKEMWFLNEEDITRFVVCNIIGANRAKRLPGEGIDTSYYKRQTKYLKPGSSEGLTFLLSARMIWEKGIGIYVEAAEKIRAGYPAMRFLLIGFMETGHPSLITKNQMDEWVQTGAVEYLGLSGNVKEVLENIDCAVLPSYYLEGVPMSLMEAASMEIPIVTTDNTGCREVVEDGVNGFLCEVKSVDSLVAALEKIIKLSPFDRERMGIAGREKVVNEFNETLVVDTYVASINRHFQYK